MARFGWTSRQTLLLGAAGMDTLIIALMLVSLCRPSGIMGESLEYMPATTCGRPLWEVREPVPTLVMCPSGTHITMGRTISLISFNLAAGQDPT
jgi:hypothetical protein